MHNSNRPNPFTHRTPLKGASRDDFIARIRKNLGHPADRSPDPGPPPTHPPGVVRQVPQAPAGSPALVDRWQKKMTDNKATVLRLPAPPASDATPLLAALDACLARHQERGGVKRALLNLQQLGAQYPIADHLRSRQIHTTEWTSPEGFLDAYQADVAITDAPAGLADTGALLVWSHQTFGRSSTLVTPIHITLLPASRILPDLVDGLSFVQQQSAKNPGGILPSNIVVINGPSKTGDIEMKLVVGVHGPKYLYVLLLDGI
ncbi:MAG TPA: lactate utilization protein [Phycisphaerae bacterium]|nr:lactate utilization protein [Phycisphaerae bacterium]